MKKILFTIALLLACTMQISAQSFSEEQLEGTWISNNDGMVYDDYFGAIQELRLGNFINMDREGYYFSGSITYEWTRKMIKAVKAITRGWIFEEEHLKDPILDYFITSNDRLHIIVDENFSLHFKIVELSDNTMKLQTKKGIMTFTKSTTGVQGLRVNTKIAEKARYNINGQRLTRPEKGINIVQMSDNSARKEVVK